MTELVGQGLFFDSHELHISYKLAEFKLSDCYEERKVSLELSGDARLGADCVTVT